jgi:hypothetical protein
MQPNNNPINTLPEPRKERLRRFLIGLLLAGIILNIVSWGGAAGFIILRQSGVSIDWGTAGGLPNIRLEGPGAQQTTSPDATLPPTPVDITSVGRPSDAYTATPTPTRSASDLLSPEPARLSATPTP